MEKLKKFNLKKPECRIADRKVAKSTNRIDSPIAKYDQAGNLMCIVCKSIVKSANVWKVHINSKQHKQKLESAIQQKVPEKEQQLQQQQPTKPAVAIKDVTEVPPPPSKKRAVVQSSISPQIVPLTNNGTQLPNASETDSNNPTNVLPEKFFDDPMSDAKVRNVDLKLDQDEEWARFQKEIKEESTMSNAIIAEEQDDDNLKRQLHEIDDQIKKWSKVIEINEKKKTLKKKDFLPINTEPIENAEISSDDSSDSDLEDWRVKRIH